MKKIILNITFVILATVAFVGIYGFNSKQEKQSSLKKLTRIAICQIVAHPALDATYAGIIDFLGNNGYVPGENTEIIYDVAQGDPLVATQIAQKFVSLKPDIIIALGTVMAQAVKNATVNSKIPVVFSSITDPLEAQLVDNLTKPGKYITGVSNWIAMEPQLKMMQQIVPTLKQIGFLYNPTEANSISLLKTLEEKAAPMGIEVISVTASNASEVAQAARTLFKQTDAVFISNDSTALSAFESIANAARFAQKPLFVSDTDILPRGAIAALGPNQYSIGEQTGEIVVQILNGAAAGDIPVAFPQKIEFHLNQDTLAGIRLAVPEDILEEVDYLFTQPAVAKTR